MKPLIKIMLTLAVFFTAMMLTFKFTGVISADKIESWLESAQQINPLYTATMVVLLLFADLFIAVPTLTITLLAGYFLGPFNGAMAVIIGFIAAGSCGYGISRKYGEVLIRVIVREPEKRSEAKEAFRKHGPIVILLSRATPVLPELSACMAGMTGMKFGKFLTLWLINSVPYAFLVAYAGSISSIDNPVPAIITAVSLTVVFGGSWLVFKKRIAADM